MAVIWKESDRARWGRKELAVDLEALEPGDRLAIVYHGRLGGGETVTVYTVSRFTATRVYLGHGSGDRKWEISYRLKDGMRIGEYGWSTDLRDPCERRVVTVLQRQRMRVFRQELEKVAGQRTEDLSQMDDVLRQIRELEEEVRSDLARMESSVKESSDAA